MRASRAEVVALARSLLKRRINFRPYGRNPRYGLDCIGVVIWVGWETGLLSRERPIPPYAFPPSTDDFKQIANHLVPATEIRPGTLLVFNNNDGLPRHVGLASHKGSRGVWRLIGSIPGTLSIGEFGLLPGLSDNVWAMFDYPDVT